MKNNRDRRFVLCNDGESLSGPADDAPMTKEKFIDVTLGPLKNTQIDTFYWQLGTDTYHGSATHRYLIVPSESIITTQPHQCGVKTWKHSALLPIGEYTKIPDH